MPREIFDVAIIGAGTAGIFAAYELTLKNPELKIVLLEKGYDIYSRSCPIVEKRTGACVSCESCAIMNGFGGAGAFSDGKFNFTTSFGGWLNEYRSDDEVMELINYVDSVNMQFGATDKLYSTESAEAKKLHRQALGHSLYLLSAKVKHLGTENNYVILTRVYEYLKDKLEFRFKTAVNKIEAVSAGYKLQCGDGETVSCKYLIAAPGRSGAEWFSDQCKSMGLKLLNNQVDIGVRVEVPAAVFEHITDTVYESKLVYRTKQYGDCVRTFCMNPNGHVVAENVGGIITVNGHSYTDKARHSLNTNFALLVSNRFTEPFAEPYKYGRHIASLSNMLGGGVIVQRFGDLLDGQRTNNHRLEGGFVRPTLSATPGDLSLVLTKRHLDNIIEMIHALDKIAPGAANYDTLLYGVEVKFYSSRLELTSELETKLSGFFAIGDGAGVTRGLAQAGASGILAARTVLGRL